MNISGERFVCVCIWKWWSVISGFPWSPSPWGSIHLSWFPVRYVSHSGLVSRRVNIHSDWLAPAHIFDLKPCNLCSVLYLQVLCGMTSFKVYSHEFLVSSFCTPTHSKNDSLISLLLFLFYFVTWFPVKIFKTRYIFWEATLHEMLRIVKNFIECIFK